MWGWLRARRRPGPLPAFPAAWRALLNARIAHVARLDAAQRERFEHAVQRFLADKRFVGCNGLEVNDEMRVLVAGLACLLILRPDAEVFPGVRAVLLYPTAFWVRHQEPDELGLVSDDPVEQIGESWGGDRVVLSWEDVEAALAGDAVNVVAHEFAHQLDDENHDSEGAPRLPDYGRWSQVMGEEFARLRRHRRPPVLDPYGAESPAEFFAVATEAYFQRGAALQARHGELYGLLKDYYGIDTAA